MLEGSLEGVLTRPVSWNLSVSQFSKPGASWSSDAHPGPLCQADWGHKGAGGHAGPRSLHRSVPV